MLTHYQKIVSPLPLVKEEPSSYLALTEQHLQVMWLEQKFFGPLKTSQGDPIEVISPGIWNTEAGPDFLKAHIRIGRHLYRGDVEIHLNDSGWRQHGHHCDPRYNGVILHLAFWEPARPLPINKENGQQPFSCYIDKCLTVPIHRILALVDFDLYPSKEFAGSGRCADQLFRTLPEPKMRDFFRSAAYWRLERKLLFLEHHFPDRPLQCAGGVAMALGYKHNATSFLELFLYLLPLRDLPRLELFAIALGCCGFLEEGRKTSWESSEYYQQLRLLWWGRKSEITHQTQLKLNRIRPLHHPVRRLYYLVQLLQDPNLETLWDTVLEQWDRPVPTDSKNPYRKLQDNFLQILPIYQDDYWDHHYTFEVKRQTKVLPSMGEDLKVHILLNTFLPLLYAKVKREGNPLQWERFQHFYASLHMTETSKSRYLHRRFFGEAQKEALWSEAQIAQGAYQLHHDFCIHFEASCEGCPFVERYKRL